MEDEQNAAVEISGEDQALVGAAERISAALDVAIEVLDEMQKIISAGKPRALKIKLGEHTLAEFPAEFTATTAFAAGLAAVLLTKLAIEMEHEDKR